MSKKLIVVLVVVVAVALAFPLSNSLRAHKMDPQLIAHLDDAEAQGVAAAYAEKCMDCHSKNTVMPFYAKFPIAKGLIERDITQARERFDIEREMLDPEVGVTEALESPKRRSPRSSTRRPRVGCRLHRTP
ncbi:MAG: heme-binding domain-containing protein [Acidobacteriota bacterium]